MKANAQQVYTEAQKAFAAQLTNKFVKGNGDKGCLKSIAADLVEFIDSDVQAESLADILLERKPAFNGTVKWNKKPDHDAYWLDEDGQFIKSKNNKMSISPPTKLITAQAVFNLLDLKRGDIASITEQADSAKDDIVKKINAYIFDLYAEAAEATMKVNSAVKLLPTAMDTALANLEDKGFTPTLWVGRASRFSDIKSDTTMGDPLTSDLKSKGVQSQMYGGANFLYAPGMSKSTVLLLSSLKPGKIQDEFSLTSRQIEADDELEMGVNLWQTTRFGITNAFRFAEITIV